METVRECNNQKTYKGCTQNPGLHWAHALSGQMEGYMQETAPETAGLAKKLVIFLRISYFAKGMQLKMNVLFDMFLMC